MAPVIEILSYIFWVLLAITILVFVHEMGHFLAAKFFGMRVDRFSIGFPPVIAGKKIGETEYVLGATPLGGYVKIAGMIDESMDTDFVGEEPKPHEFRAKPVWQRIIVISAGVVFNVILAAAIYTGLKATYGEEYVPADNVESVYVEDASVAYRMGLRTGDRIVAVNGEKLERFGNLQDIDALTADALTLTVEREGRRRTLSAPKNLLTQLTRANRRGEGFGISYRPAIVGGVMKGSAAEKAGLQTGDRIVSLGGEPVRFWAELTDQIQASEGRPLSIQWRRPDSLAGAQARSQRRADGTTAEQQALPAPTRPSGEGLVFEATVKPERDSASGRYLLGVRIPGEAIMKEEFGVRRTTFSLGGALVAGLEQTWENTRGIVVSLKRVFVGRDSFRENVGGPVAIAQVTKEAAEAGARYFWGIVAFLSITLAIMNILPIPALDGGHLVFLIYEGIARRAPSARVRMALQQIGFVVLIVFMAFVIFNDILRL